METTIKPHTIDELLTTIYEENYSHLEFIVEMTNQECDCKICVTMRTILEYWGE